MFPNTGNRLSILNAYEILIYYEVRPKYVPAPPAIVPKRNLLISMTFLTVPEAIMIANYVSRKYASAQRQGSRTDVTSCCRSRVNSYNDATFESKCEGSGTVLNLDST